MFNKDKTSRQGNKTKKTAMPKIKPIKDSGSLSEPKEKSKLDKILTRALIVLGAVALAMAVGFFLMIKTDDGPTTGVDTVVDSGQQGLFDPNVVQGEGLYEEGTEGEEQYEGILGEEAEGEVDPDLVSRPWFALGQEEVEAEKVGVKAVTSAKASALKGRLITLLRNTSKKNQSNVMTEMGDGMGDSSSSLEDLSNQINDAVNNQISGNLNSGPQGGNQSESQDTYYKDLYEELLNNQNKGDSTPQPPTPSPVEPDSGQGSGGNTTEPKPTEPEPQPQPQPQPNPEPSEDDTSGAPKKINSPSEFTGANGKSVVASNSSGQFRPLDNLESTFYVVDSNSYNIAKYFSNLTSSYKGQLLIEDIDYELVKGYSNVYKVTPKYLISLSEFDKIKAEARQFKAKNASNTSQVTITNLAKEIASKATYGNSSNKYSPYALLQGENVVCHAYASLAQIYLDELGYMNHLATGQMKSEPHVWNVIRVGNKELHYDFTLYDTQSNSNKYLGMTGNQLTDRTIQSVIR